MSPSFEPVFTRLKSILQRQAGTLTVKADTSSCYCLEGSVGPATLRAWRGKRKSPTIPVMWVQVGKTYVSFHHMALYGNARLRDAMSKELRSHMQGKTCLSFKAVDEALFRELEELTASGCRGMKNAGFVE